jgi:putative membrane protein
MKFSEIATAQTMRLIARATAAGRLAIEPSGLDNVPRHGPVILAARHYHHLFDGLALLLAVPRPTHFVITLDWAQHRFTRAAMATLARFARWPVVLRAPPHRQTRFTGSGMRRLQRDALQEAVRLLIEQRALVIFPEGYPNIDPHYTPKREPEEHLPFKGGFAALAAAAERQSRARIPIVPVGLHYLRGDRWQVRLRFGTPIGLSDFASRPRLIAHVEEQVRLLSKIEN